MRAERPALQAVTLEQRLHAEPCFRLGVAAVAARAHQDGRDPAGGRRTWVRVADDAAGAISRGAARRIDDTIGRGVADPADARRALDLLDAVAHLLLPTRAELLAGRPHDHRDNGHIL